MATASGVSTHPQLSTARRVGCCTCNPAPDKNLFQRRAVAGAAAGTFFVKRDIVYKGLSCHQFLPLKQRKRLQAAVLPVTSPLLDDEEKRRQMSEDYGFKQIGAQLPDNVTLKDVMDSLPKEE